MSNYARVDQASDLISKMTALYNDIVICDAESQKMIADISNVVQKLKNDKIGKNESMFLSAKHISVNNGSTRTKLLDKYLRDDESLKSFSVEPNNLTNSRVMNRRSNASSSHIYTNYNPDPNKNVLLKELNRSMNKKFRQRVNTNIDLENINIVPSTNLYQYESDLNLYSPCVDDESNTARLERELQTAESVKKKELIKTISNYSSTNVKEIKPSMNHFRKNSNYNNNDLTKDTVNKLLFKIDKKTPAGSISNLNNMVKSTISQVKERIENQGKRISQAYELPRQRVQTINYEYKPVTRERTTVYKTNEMFSSKYKK